MTSSHQKLHGIADTLQARGARLTKARLALLEFLCNQDKPVSVKEIEHQLRNINIVTLYRMLDYLVAQNVVKVLTHNPKEQYFEIADPYHDHHHHTICRTCGKIRDIHCQLKVPPLRGFIPEMHVVTIYGRCKTCA